MSTRKTDNYDPTPPKLTYLFGDDFFADDKEQDRLDRERAFKRYLQYLSDGNTKVYSRRRAGLSASTIETKRNNSTEFRALEERAFEEGSDCIEQEAIRRGRDGVVKDVYYKGEVVGQELQYSDSLLISVLKSKKPEYRESRIVGTQTLDVTNKEAPAIDVTKYTEEELLLMEELLSRSASGD